MAKAVLSPTMEAPDRDSQTPSFADISELHLLISEMDDELSAYRWREAIWISIIVHVVGFLLWIFAPRYLPRTAVLLPATMPTKENPIFLTDRRTPPAPRPQRSDIISDQNRIAQSHKPLLSRDQIRRLMNVQPPGTPARTTAPPAPPQQAAQQPQQPAQQASSEQAGAQQQQQQPTQTAHLDTPPVPKGPSPFKTAAPGAAIHQALEDVAGSHGANRYAFGGDFGVDRHQPNSDVRGDVEILSDTMGVDFGPYLQRVLWEIKTHWYQLVPESALPPMMKKGQLGIQFAILKDGKVAGMQQVFSSNDIALDRAAWGGIVNSSPFQPLPSAFKGNYLELRIRFLYNPDKNELQ